jgi:hypothetical protein
MSEQAQEPVDFLGHTRETIRKGWRDIVGGAQAMLWGS